MVEQKTGAIVNFSSMAAFRPMTRVAGYAAAKAGISNFTAFMAEELCGTIQYLISDASSFVTGTVAVVDGGFNAFAM